MRSTYEAGVTVARTLLEASCPRPAVRDHLVEHLGFDRVAAEELIIETAQHLRTLVPA